MCVCVCVCVCVLPYDVCCAVYYVQVLEIDSSSEEGETPNSFDSTIQFNNVSFNYPSRPDVPVGSSTTTYNVHVASLHG